VAIHDRGDGVGAVEAHDPRQRWRGVDLRQPIGEFYRLHEFVRSQTAVRRRIDNTPSPEVIANLQKAAKLLWDPMRLRWGPMYVSSGYRCQELNRAIGSSDRSAHVFGCAADLVPLSSTVTFREVMEWFRTCRLPHDQIIWEFGEWLHVAIARPMDREPKRQLLMTFDGKSYLPWDPEDPRVARR
jgi:zinc D-Ala-D-Ala carboxypeptidase